MESERSYHYTIHRRPVDKRYRDGSTPSGSRSVNCSAPNQCPYRTERYTTGSQDVAHARLGRVCHGIYREKEPSLLMQVNCWDRKRDTQPCPRFRQIPSHPTPRVLSDHPSKLVAQEPSLCRRSCEQSNDRRCERRQKPDIEPSMRHRRHPPLIEPISSGDVFSEQKQSVRRRRLSLPETW